MKDLQQKSKQIAKARSERMSRHRLISLMAALVVVATAVALMAPAISMTRGELECGLEEHQHSDACYEQVLVCGYSDTVDAGAATADVADEAQAHVHTEACYERRLVCEMPGHIHSSACYAEPADETSGQVELVVQEAADVADAEASAGESDVVDGGISESGDAATEGQADLGDSDDEAIEADSTDDSNPDSSAGDSAVDVQGEGPDAAEQGEPADAGVPGDVVDDAGEVPMPAQSLAAEADLGDGKVLRVSAECGEGVLPEGATMRLSSLPEKKADGVVELVRREAEAQAGVPVDGCDITAADVQFLNAAGDVIRPQGPVQMRIAHPAIEEGANFALLNVVYAGTEASLAVQDEASTEDSGATTQDVVADSEANSESQDAANGEPQPEQKDTAVVLDPDVVDLEGHAVELEGATPGTYALAVTPPVGNEEPNEAADDKDAAGSDVAGSNAASSLDMPATTFTADVEAADGSTVKVAVRADAGAFPEGTTMEASLVTDEDVIDAAKAEAADELGAKAEKTRALAVDITFFDAEGNPIEPAKDVRVSVKAREIADQEQLAVVHVDDDSNAELLDPDGVAAKGSKVSFDAAEFSVYAIVYTVDFHWEVDGKTYEFNIPGGGFVTLQQLVEVLGIANNDAYGEENSAASDNAGEEQSVDSGNTLSNATNEEIISLSNVTASEATKNFVADVANVEISNPDLIWVGKTEGSTSIGQLKEMNGLEYQFSAELTEEQIAKINRSTIEAGDWALISLRPFTSEETLTVTMKNGNQLAIKVTDYQISTNVLAADGKTYKITVIYDDHAKIPDGTKLIAREIEPGTDEYLQYFGKTWTEVNKDYFNSKEEQMKADGDSSPLSETPIINFSEARFFDISLLNNGKEIEPKAPVQVQITYEKGMKCESPHPIIGVAHFMEDKIELIDQVKVDRESDGDISGFLYEQNSFSGIGTYSGQEGENNSASLRAPSMELLGASPDGSGELGSPDPVKSLVNNDNDGTYTLSLSVTGQQAQVESTDVTKSNVVIVMDRSSSMRHNVATYTEYTGTPQNGVQYYGADGSSHFEITSRTNPYTGRVDWTRSVLHYANDYYGNTYSYYNTEQYTGTVYTKTDYGKTKLKDEQDALEELIKSLLSNNKPGETITDSHGNTVSLDDVVEISVLSFADQALKNQASEVDWSTNEDALLAGINQTNMPSGTNWEDALIYAKDKADQKANQPSQQGEDTYVIFLTDGEPTAIAGETGGAHHYDKGVYKIYNDGPEHLDEEKGGFDYALTGNGYNSATNDGKNALDRAKAIADAGYKFYGIFTYGDGPDQEAYLQRLVNYSYGHGDNTNSSQDLTDHYYSVQNSSELTDAFNNIFSKVYLTKGHAQVKITDGIRQDAMSFKLVEGENGEPEMPASAVYTVTPKGSQTPLYTVTATMPEDGSDPVVVFTIDGHDYSTADENSLVEIKTNPADDPNDPNDNLATYNSGSYYSVTVDNVEYKMVLADVVPTATDNVSTLTWDLKPLGMLQDDCVYQANFIVWPNQDAYDYVSALNNGLTEIADPNGENADPIPVVWNQGDATPVEDSEHKIYYEGGCEKYPSIVYYPDPDKEDDPDHHIYYGTFAVLSNTDQNLDYSVVTTKQDEVISVEPQPQIPMELPDPMPLEDTSTFVLKKWIVDRDAGVLAQYLYDLEGNPKKFKIKLDIYQGKVTDSSVPYRSVNIGWDETAGAEGEGAYVWEGPFVDAHYGDNVYTIGTHWKADFDISAGLILSEARMKELKLDNSGYPFATYEGDGKKYYILEPGHDYTIKEDGDNIGFEFDFDPPVYHPMLVDGVMKNVNITKSGNNYTINSIAPTPLDSLGLKVENNLRAYIHLNKVVLDKDGNLWPADKTRFEYTINLHSPIKLEGEHIPWYGVNGLFYHDRDFNYYQADPIFEGENQKEGVLTLKTESGHECQATCDGFFNPKVYGPTEITYTDENNKEKTIQLYGNMMEAAANQQDIHVKLKICQDESLNIANIPAESTYTITESPVDEYALVDIAPDNSAMSQRKISGEIVANADNYITFTNKVIAGSLDITKAVLVDGQSADASSGYADGVYSFTITDADGNPAMGKVSGAWIEDGKVSIEIKNGEAKTVRVTDLRIGEYAITEDKPENGTTLVGFAVNGQPKTVENGAVADDNDKKVTVVENTVATASFTNNVNTIAVEVEKVWTDDKPSGANHSQTISYSIHRKGYKWVDDDENPGQKTWKYIETQLVDQNLVSSMDGYTGELSYAENQWKEVVHKLPKTSAVWNQQNEEFEYYKYEYFVTEDTPITGYKSMISGGEITGEGDAQQGHDGAQQEDGQIQSGDYSFTITNEPLGPTDQVTGFDVKKQWNDADGNPDLNIDNHKNEEVVFTVTQRKYKAQATDVNGRTAKLYPITIVLKDENGVPGSGHVKNKLSTVVYVPDGAEFNITPIEANPAGVTNPRDHYVEGFGFGADSGSINHRSGETYTISRINSATEITLDLHAGYDQWHKDFSEGEQDYHKWKVAMYSPQGIIWDISELLDKVLDNQKQVQDLMVLEETYDYTMKLTAAAENGLPTIIANDDEGIQGGAQVAGSQANAWEGSFTNLMLFEYHEGEQMSYVYEYDIEEMGIRPAAGTAADTVSTTNPPAIDATTVPPTYWNGQTSEYLVKWVKTWDEEKETYVWTLTNQKKPPIEVTLYKVDKDDVPASNDIPDSSSLLKGAKFKLVKYTSLKPRSKDMDWGTDGESDVIQDDSQNYGIFSFDNLDAGYYEIVETQCPPGYIQADEKPVFQVRYNNGAVAPEAILVYGSDDDSGHKAGDPITGNTTDMVSIANYAIVVGNTPGVALPVTGGPGTYLLTFFGTMLALFAGAWMIAMRRRQRDAA